LKKENNHLKFKIEGKKIKISNLEQLKDEL